MTPTNSDDVSIPALLRAYACGERTPGDVLAAMIARIAASDRKGIWISVATEQQIQEQLARLENARQAGRSLPLYGIPFGVKDNIDVAGMPTTAACEAYRYVPSRSATSVQKLLDAGAICVVKTNLDQFATGLVGTRSPYGVCENFYNREWISGGSSSGSALAVSAGHCSFTLGTDTAGSGRVPAAFNNLVGLNPTRGLVSAAGVVPACRSLDCVSIFSKTCAEAQTILNIMTGPDPEDGYSRSLPTVITPFSTPLRVGIPQPEQLEFFGNTAMAQLFDRAVERVRQWGARLVTIDFSPFLKAGQLLYGGPWVAERLVAAGQLLKENPKALRPELQTILKGALAYTATDAFEGQYKLAGLRRAADIQWAQMDTLLCPTVGTIYRISEIAADPLRLNQNLGYYTTYANLLDLTALAVPCGFLPSGIPMGVQFVAPAFHDALVLAVGGKFHAELLKEQAP